MVLGQLCRRFGNGDANLDPAREATQQGSRPPVWRAVTGGVEGADHWCGTGEEHGDRDAGRQRLMQMQNVESPSADRPYRAGGGSRLGRHWRDRAVDAESERPPGADSAAVSRHFSGRDDGDLVSLTLERPGQAEDLLLHSSGCRQAVRAHKADAHALSCSRPSGCLGQGTAARARSPWPAGLAFARSSGPCRASSSGVNCRRRVPNSRSASGSRKLRFMPSATWWM